MAASSSSSNSSAKRAGLATIGFIDRCQSYGVTADFRGEAAYRLVSCLAHGFPWSISVIRHEPISEALALPNTVISRATGSPAAIVKVTRWGLDTFAAALGDAERYIGAPAG